MDSYEKFYREKLYPFQDGVLNIVKKLKTPFYLTGGTALSRCYYNHRFSDDLDFFVNNEKGYSSYVDYC
ncbi:MAG: nucleotidyl transferase AbiEii/AbiGii toxin family protein [bacterium]|nr:nucleotidyl transferase AbiEii/AbiGii toxin family protein [bacterium]